MSDGFKWLVAGLYVFFVSASCISEHRNAAKNEPPKHRSDCYCLKLGECFCEDPCLCWSEPEPKPVPVDPFPVPVDPPPPDDVGPIDDDGKKTVSPLCQCDAGGTPCKCVKCECGLLPLKPQVAKTSLVIVHGNEQQFRQAKMLFDTKGIPVAWERVECVGGVCVPARYTVETPNGDVPASSFQAATSIYQSATQQTK